MNCFTCGEATRRIYHGGQHYECAAIERKKLPAAKHGTVHPAHHVIYLEGPDKLYIPKACPNKHVDRKQLIGEYY